MSQEIAGTGSVNIERGVEIRPVRTLELTPSPINPNMDPLELRGAFGGNLDLAIGGRLTFSGGPTVATDGIIGRAIREERHQQLERDMTAQSLEGARADGADYGGRVRVLGYLIRETGAVRLADAEVRRVDQEGIRRGSGVREQLNRRQEEFNNFVQMEDLNDEILQEYNAIVEIDAFLQANPNSGDFQPIEAYLRTLGLEPADVSVKELRAEVRASGRSSEFRKYRAITRGSGEGEKHVKGLYELKAEHKAMEVAREDELTAARERAAVVRGDANRWESAYNDFKGGSTEDRVSRQRIQQYQEVERFLQAHYLPNGQEIVRVGYELEDAEGEQDEVAKLWAESSQAQKYLDQVSGTGGGLRRSIVSRFDPFKQAREVVDKKVATLKAQLVSLTHPEVRLRAPGAPKALVDAVNIATRQPNININEVPEGQRVLVEAALCLLGKQSLVKLDELPEEIAAAVAVEPALAPEAAAPVEAATEAVQQPESVVLDETLTTEQLQQLPKQRIADAVLQGGTLTIDQLAALNPDTSLDGYLDRLLVQADSIETVRPITQEIKQEPGVSPDITDRIIAELGASVAALLKGKYPDLHGYFNRDDLSDFVTKRLSIEGLSTDEKEDLEQTRRALTVITYI